jgi:hypothetical protein
MELGDWISTPNGSGFEEFYLKVAFLLENCLLEPWTERLHSLPFWTWIWWSGRRPRVCKIPLTTCLARPLNSAEGSLNTPQQDARHQQYHQWPMTKLLEIPTLSEFRYWCSPRLDFYLTCSVLRNTPRPFLLKIPMTLKEVQELFESSVCSAF